MIRGKLRDVILRVGERGEVAALAQIRIVVWVIAVGGGVVM